MRFRNNADKSLVWGAKSHITDHHVSISDNYCADTEYKRNRLYMVYKKAKSLDKFKQKTSLSGDVLVIDGSHYTVEDLHNLPDELNIRQFSEKLITTFTCLEEFIAVLIPLVTGIRARFNTRVTRLNP